MKLKIDNFDGTGLSDYSKYVAESPTPRIHRRLNRPSQFELALISSTPEFVVPVAGARMVVERGDTGGKLFTGYLTEAPQFEYLGWGENGPVYRYALHAESDEFVLDRKRLPARQPMVGRTAGEALRQITEDLMPGGFDLSGVEDLEVIPSYSINPQKSWSEHAAEIALLARSSYRAQEGAIVLRSLGASSQTVDENQDGFCPRCVKVKQGGPLANDVTVMGDTEPRAHVRAYFLGDGMTLNFDLPETPYMSYGQLVLEEEYGENQLRATRWTVADPASAIAVSGGKLQVNGGTGVDGQTEVRFVEQIELGGALVLQHGDISFGAESDGVLGGLYAGGISAGGCLAGFRISKSGGQSAIRALVNGVGAGVTISTQAGHRYGLTTRLYATEMFRQRQRFHSSRGGVGGTQVGADVRVVLEAHDIDPGNPATLVAAATVLYDGVISAAPGYCHYALVNAVDLHCAIAFTRISRSPYAEVRSAPAGQGYRTRLTGSAVEGAECRIANNALYFFPQYVPASAEKIVVKYRSLGRALARVTDGTSIAAEQRPGDDGVRSMVRKVTLPPARTSVDCENAALALLEDGTRLRGSGEYQVWSDCLPGGPADCFPGDGLEVNLASRGVSFRGTVREVVVELANPQGERSQYAIRLADDSSEPVSFQFTDGTGQAIAEVEAISKTEAGTRYIADLAGAEVTEVSSTMITVDAGGAAPAGGGFEVRRSDYGWGAENDRNLTGRFNTRVFTLPRLARAQTYYLRQYDGSTPAKYSRYSTLLRVDYPL